MCIGQQEPEGCATGNHKGVPRHVRRRQPQLLSPFSLRATRQDGLSEKKVQPESRYWSNQKLVMSQHGNREGVTADLPLGVHRFCVSIAVASRRKPGSNVVFTLSH